MSSCMGTLFRVATWGESHGGAVGVVVDGCPPRVPISLEEVQVELDRRRPGQSKIVSQRKETDQVQILSGIQDGLTLGTPICMLVWNEDARPQDYDELREKFRPSHADFTYRAKYGIRAWSGGGRASARETVGRVAAGAIARKLLALWHGVEIVAWVEKVRNVRATVDPASVTRQAVESNDVRCPVTDVAEQMRQLIEEVRKAGDSVGGVVGCVARGVPPGWGDPVFDKLEADLAKAVMSLPACKGFEVGSGFAGTDLTGSQHNDEFYIDESVGERGPGGVYTPTNLSGGIQGGISNGMPITMRAAFKPTATILRSQHTVSEAWQNTTITGRGRHDPCVLPRAVPMVEAMVSLVLADAALRHRSITW